MKFMKCDCPECEGSGEVQCPDCGGSGQLETSIEDIILDKKMENFEELKALQKDAKRIIKQTNELCALNPGRKSSYVAQMQATLAVVNGLAEKALK